MSLFIARLRSYRGQSGRTNMYGRLTVDRVLIDFYRPGLTALVLNVRSQQVNVAQIVHECTSLLRRDY